MAACRLWVAGLGMFLLARSWGLGHWGRWFAGLAFPFCGFLILWLLYPVTPVAIWMPWLFLATDVLFRRPSLKAAGWLATVVALIVLGGHIQTSAHVLLAGGLYAVARVVSRAEVTGRPGAAFLCWALGVCLGLAVASVQILPLAGYLARSPVWSDRRLEHAAWWKPERPRLLELACTAVPYVYGSQRRGQPNLARPLGVNNLNESAGGFAGLGTLVWLAPLAVVSRGRSFRAAFLVGLGLCGAMGAVRIPPVDNLLRALPVLEVTDNRRLSLWVAFALVLLGGIGLDSLGESRRLPRFWIGAWLASGVLFAAMAAVLPLLESQLTARAVAHYRESAAATAGADALLYRERALRQVSQALYFLPRYYGLIALELGVLAGLFLRLRAAQRELGVGSTGCAFDRSCRPGRTGAGLEPGDCRKCAFI